MFECPYYKKNISKETERNFSFLCQKIEASFCYGFLRVIYSLLLSYRLVMESAGSELRGSLSGETLEGLTEMVVISKACLLGNLIGSQVRLGQHFFCRPDTDDSESAYKGVSGLFSE